MLQKYIKGQTNTKKYKKHLNTILKNGRDMDLSRRNDELLSGKVKFSIEILIHIILNEDIYVVIFFSKISGPCI